MLYRVLNHTDRLLSLILGIGTGLWIWMRIRMGMGIGRRRSLELDRLIMSPRDHFQTIQSRSDDVPVLS